MNSPNEVAIEALRDLISQRVRNLLSEDPEGDVAGMVLHVVRVAALEYSARYLRSIMAERAAELLDERIMEMELEELDLDAEDGYCGHTIIGLGVRRVPAAMSSFTWK